jgi:hypothetical protein
VTRFGTTRTAKWSRGELWPRVRSSFSSSHVCPLTCAYLDRRPMPTDVGGRHGRRGAKRLSHTTSLRPPRRGPGLPDAAGVARVEVEISSRTRCRCVHRELQRRLRDACVHAEMSLRLSWLRELCRNNLLNSLPCALAYSHRPSAILRPACTRRGNPGRTPAGCRPTM